MPHSEETHSTSSDGSALASHPKCCCPRSDRVSRCLRTPRWRCTGCWERPGLLHLHNAQHQSTAGTLPARCEHLPLNMPGAPLTCIVLLSLTETNSSSLSSHTLLQPPGSSPPPSLPPSLSQPPSPSSLPLGSAHAASALPGASQKAVNSDARQARWGCPSSLLSQPWALTTFKALPQSLATLFLFHEWIKWFQVFKMS